ncbi:OmpW/AlkL family protein [Microbulbifer yueqingensis]|uniref:Outer membrane protein n=1 Tax=Microbulbifer yueqingensis TaxID=658219 RepID=A0A1G8XZJ6_9GAMM|nr:OmpW family outer membrane protein [Microbulbifer yueqingensis]SDJ95963.1 outer membrane protein [Microbulbifer yueqingensis]
MKSIAALAGLLVSMSATAYQPGELILRSGAATVSPDTGSSALFLDGSELAGTAVDVEDGTALGLTGTYMLTGQWGVELVAASPFSHDIEVQGLGQPLALGDTSHLPPTLLLQWYPRLGGSPLQPYLGLGVNYTAFFDEQVDGAANELFAALGATGEADLSLENSVGLAVEAGVDFSFGQDRRWLLNMSVLWMDIDTEAEVHVPGVGTIAADVELDPLVTVAGLGYRF